MGLHYRAVNIEIIIPEISTFYKYFRIQFLAAVSKQYLHVFYSKISKLISFEKLKNVALLNTLNVLHASTIYTL